VGSGCKTEHGRLDVGDKSSVGSEGLRHENDGNGFLVRAETAGIVDGSDRGSDGGR